jgi:glyoxylase-like metal-dependent hydrolase (beta-lactamase superfamily II)
MEYIKNTMSQSTISRRHFLQAAAASATAAHFAPHTLFAQPPATSQEPAVILKFRGEAATAKITTQNLRRNVSVLIGSGGNILVLTSKEGKLLVDAGYSTSRPQITEALASLNSDPIRILVSTHWHFDHTDGNEWIHSAGATIWAHENTRTRMSTTQEIKDFDAIIPPSPAGALPTVIFNTDRTINGAGNTVQLTHYNPAHTDTDISVNFLEANIIHIGDTFFNGHFPFIDYSTGGSLNGMIHAIEHNIATGTADTLFVPGHGPVAKKPQLVEYQTMLLTSRDRVSALKKQGRSIDEVIAAKPAADYNAKWGTYIISQDLFTRVVYEGV